MKKKKNDFTLEAYYYFGHMWVVNVRYFFMP